MKDLRKGWMLLALSLLLLRAVLPVAWVEAVYSRGLFPVFRRVWDFLLGWSPLPWAFFLLLGLLFWTGRSFFLFFRKNKKRGKKEAALEALWGLGGFAGMVVSLFLLMWGLHYGRAPLESRLGLEVPALDSAALTEEAYYWAEKTVALRAELARTDTLVPAPRLSDRALEDHLRDCLEAELLGLGYPAAGRARCRVLPEGTLLRLGIAGIYVPFSGEGHVDGAIHPLERCYTMAHEMAHALGIPGEADCNLLAALACARSDDPVVRYGGALEHWRLVMGELYAVAPDAFRAIRAQMPDDIRRDLRTLRVSTDRYPDWFPEWSGAVNHAYLQAQGVREGIKSYDRAVGLMRAMRLKGPLGQERAR